MTSDPGMPRRQRRRGAWIAVLVVGLLSLTALSPTRARTLAATLDTHDVSLDGGGQIVSWVQPQDQAYARVAALSFGLLENGMPIDPGNGKPIVYAYSEYNPTNLYGSDWPNNPAGKNAMLADAARMYYAFAGDSQAVALVLGLLRHQIEVGSTPLGYNWGGVPWSTGEAGSLTYGDDALREGSDVIEPDKLGELGYHGYLWAYEMTGDALYLDAAIRCANELVDHIQPGSATHSPWPFRVDAESGDLVEEYCADVIAPIRLFDELIRLNQGNVAAYQAARTTAWNWLMTYPIANNVWTNYFEDVPVVSDMTNTNQYDAGQTARYLLEHPQSDPNWQAHVAGLISWIQNNFGGTDNGESGLQYGARTISEQQRYKYKMASHTGRFAAVNALYAEATGDLNAKDKAFRSLNWCTYMCRSNGVVIEGPFEAAHDSTCWFTDGHGDFIRHFLLAMGAFPEWAPAHENHMVRASSVVRSIHYGRSGVDYTTFDAAGSEVLRMAFTPLGVLANDVPLDRRADLAVQGWTFDSGTGVLRIRHDNAQHLRIVVDSSLGRVPGTPGMGPIQISPNPTSAEVQLAFSLPVLSAVDLSVTDITGRRVRTLLKGVLPAGSHSLQWDGRDASGKRVGAGLYVVSLRRGNEVRSASVVRVP